MPMLQRFAAGRKVLRRDDPAPRGVQAPRRSFLATVAAGLGLASAPAVASEWEVVPDEPGPLMAAWRAVQQADADYSACPRPSSADDDSCDEAIGFHGDQLSDRIGELVTAVAAAAGMRLVDLKGNVERDSIEEVPGLAAVREGSTLFILSLGGGYGIADHHVELGQREHKGRSFPIGFFVKPVIFEGFFGESD